MLMMWLWLRNTCLWLHNTWAACTTDIFGVHAGQYSHAPQFSTIYMQMFSDYKHDYNHQAYTTQVVTVRAALRTDQSLPLVYWVWNRNKPPRNKPPSHMYQYNSIKILHNNYYYYFMLRTNFKGTARAMINMIYTDIQCPQSKYNN